MNTLKVILALIVSTFLSSCAFDPSGGGNMQSMNPRPMMGGGYAGGGYSNHQQPQRQHYGNYGGYNGANRLPYSNNNQNYYGRNNPSYRDHNQTHSVLLNPPGVNAMGYEMYKAQGGGTR